MHSQRIISGRVRPLVLSCLLGLVLLLIPASQALAQDDGDEGPKSPDECATCHAEEYGIWQESTHAGSLTDPDFIEAWNRAGQPAYCKSCHATGYDAVSGNVQYEGVGCLACHADSEGNHPSSDMTVNDSSELCGTCHRGTHAPDYDQWLVSDHATMDIGCTDCHQSHNTILHLEDPTQLCTSCHKDLDTSLHGQQGMACHDCHMAAGDQVVDPLSGQTNGSGHTFGIPSNVCADCHGMSHTTPVDAGSTGSETTQISADYCSEDVAAASSKQLNLGLTGGGIGGLIIGIAVPWLLHRRDQR